MKEVAVALGLVNVGLALYLLQLAIRLLAIEEYKAATVGGVMSLLCGGYAAWVFIG